MAGLDTCVSAQRALIIIWTLISIVVHVITTETYLTYAAESIAGEGISSVAATCETPISVVAILITQIWPC